MAQESAAVASTFSPVKILVADDHATVRKADQHLIDAARKFGARAFVPKTETALALVKAIEAAIRNDEFFVVE